MLKWIKNSKGAPSNKSSKYKGVTYQKNKGKYRAVLQVSTKDIKGDQKVFIKSIGYYDTEKEAKKARVDYILSLL